MTDAMKRIEELRKVIQSRDEMTTGVMELFDLAESLAAELDSIRGAGDEDVRDSLLPEISNRLEDAFNSGNAVKFSIAAADCVVFAETCLGQIDRLGRTVSSQCHRIKELEAENEDVQHAMGVLERAGFTGFELPLKPETAKDAASKAIVYRVEL